MRRLLAIAILFLFGCSCFGQYVPNRRLNFRAAVAGSGGTLVTNCTDTFSGGDSSPVAAPWQRGDVGSGYGNFNVFSGHLEPNNLSLPTYYLLTNCANNANQFAEINCTITGSDQNSFIGPIVRGVFQAGVATNFYTVGANHNTTNNAVKLYKCVNSSYTILAAFAQTWTNGDKWRLEITNTSPATLTVKWLGTTLTNITDSSISAAGSPGVFYNPDGSVVPPTSVDNFGGGNL